MAGGKDNDWKTRLGVVYSTNPDFAFDDGTAGTEEDTDLGIRFMDGTEAETDSQRDQVGIRSECPNDQVAVTTFENGIGASASMEAQGEKTSNSAEENECAVA